MSNTENSALNALEKKLLQVNKNNTNKIVRDLVTVQNRVYAQLESLSWLQRRLVIKGQLPPLRGWATSPDVLLRLHTHIMATRPKVVVEFGSGASTLVIADALSQNGKGRLISIEHSEHYGSKTLENLRGENLDSWVDLRIGDLEAWDGVHLNPEETVKPSYWYPQSLMEDLSNIDLLWVDGPPAATCLYSRYPAVPALADKFSHNVEVWMDDTIRREEREICELWAEEQDFELEYSDLEKGLGRLTKANVSKTVLSSSPQTAISNDDELIAHTESEVRLDFSLPGDQRSDRS